MKYVLRDYQQEAVDACMEYLDTKKGDPVIVAPTGAGKSLIIAALIKRLLKYDGVRGMMLTHVKELIEQNHEKVKALCPDVEFGIYSAGLNQRDTTRDITFAGIQSVYKRALEFGSVNLIIIDECHLVSPEESTRYARFIKELRAINPKLRVVGLTATPYRMKEGVILGKGMFDDICYEIEIPRLINEGYLSPLKTKGGIKEVDLKDVKLIAGDYNEKQMSQAFMRDDFQESYIDEILKYGKDRKSWLLFCCDLAHAKGVQGELLDKGITCGYVDGKMNKADRAQVLDDFKSGKIKALCNVGVLTTGFDHPEIDLVVLLRATMSTTLYVQMLGRSMRIHKPLSKSVEKQQNRNNEKKRDYKMNIVFIPKHDWELKKIKKQLQKMGRDDICVRLKSEYKKQQNDIVEYDVEPNKDYALILDYGWNVERHGAVDIISVKKKSFSFDDEMYKIEKTPFKKCPSCMGHHHPRLKLCPECGHEYPPPELDKKASKKAILSIDEEPRTLKIENVVYSLHKKKDKPPSLRVTYEPANFLERAISEWVCLEHDGFARQKAVQWWSNRSPHNKDLTPTLISEALERVNELKKPIEIIVRKDGKYDKINKFIF